VPWCGLGIVHTIGGSIAASFAGEPRSTIDIDFVVAIEQQHVSALVGALTPAFYIDEDALRRAIRINASTNLIEQRTQLELDLFVAAGTPLDEQQLKRRLEVRLGRGRTLHVHPPEDILLQKLRWYRQGGEQSDRAGRQRSPVRAAISSSSRRTVERHDGSPSSAWAAAGFCGTKNARPGTIDRRDASPT
jgi:hypothetical protein